MTLCPLACTAHTYTGASHILAARTRWWRDGAYGHGRREAAEDVAVTGEAAWKKSVETWDVMTGFAKASANYTAGYAAEVLRGTGAKTTRLAFGLPADSGIAYSDPLTLRRAINGRRGF